MKKLRLVSQSLLHNSYENDCEQVRETQLDVHSISVPEYL